MLDTAFGAESIERMTAGWFVPRLILHIDGEAVGELGPIVGEDGMNGMREVSQKALQEPGRGVSIALGMDLQIDVAGGAIDGDESIAFMSLQRWQVLPSDELLQELRDCVGSERVALQYA